MQRFRLLYILISVFIIIIIVACSKTDSAPFNNDLFNVDGIGSLYVASGSCYGGGVATAAGPANTVAKYNLSTGALEQIVIDYNRLAPGDSPIAINDYSPTQMLVLVENASGRRVDLVNKDGSGASTYLVNTTALGAVMRSMVLLSDYSLLVSKSTAIEKFTSSKARILQGANPFVSAPAGSCATTATLITSVTAFTNGKIVYTHSAASPNNKIAVISASGYSVAGDCLSGTAAPTTLAMPTKALFHPNNKLLVSYGALTAANNFVYSYDFNASTGAISNPVAVYNDGGTLVNGPSAMAVDPTTGDVFVANATAAYNTIERFRFASNAFTRIGSQSFVAPSVYTRCVSDMKVMH